MDFCFLCAFSYIKVDDIFSGKKSVFDQSVMLKDDDNFLKIAEDLRKNSPRSFAKKLRDLMVK